MYCINQTVFKLPSTLMPKVYKFQLWVYLTFVLSKYLCRPV